MRINSIFDSLQGEVDGYGGQGVPTTFVRLQGCNLRCDYCDTKDALSFTGGVAMEITEILEMIDREKVTITGGEPLMQEKELVELLNLLLPKHKITIETNGSRMPHIDLWTLRCSTDRLRFVVDFKLDKPINRMAYSFFEHLAIRDVIKFVVGTQADYRAVKKVYKKYKWQSQIAISPIIPSDGNLSWAKELAKLLIGDDTFQKAAFNLQLHKLLDIS